MPTGLEGGGGGEDVPRNDTLWQAPFLLFLSACYYPCLGPLATSGLGAPGAPLRLALGSTTLAREPATQQLPSFQKSVVLSSLWGYIQAGAPLLATCCCQEGVGAPGLVSPQGPTARGGHGQAGTPERSPPLLVALSCALAGWLQCENRRATSLHGG